MDNRRTLEFFLLAGFIGIAGPCAVLLGAEHGRQLGAAAFPNSGTEEAGAAAEASPVAYPDSAMGGPESAP